MMQYSRDKYFPQLRIKVINPIGEPSKTSLATSTHTNANTCTQRKQESCQSPWRLLARINSDSDRQINKLENKIKEIKLQQGIFGFYI